MVGRNPALARKEKRPFPKGRRSCIWSWRSPLLTFSFCFFTGGLGAVAIVDGAIFSAAVDDDDDMILGCCFSAWNIL